MSYDGRGLLGVKAKTLAVNSEPIKAWLNRTLRAAKVWNVVGVLASLLFGLLVLYVSFWAAYVAIWIISHSFFHLSNRTILVLAWSFMALVAAVGARQNWKDIEPVERQERLAENLNVTLTPWTRYGMSYRTDAVKAGAFEVLSVAALVNYILCGGVKLVLGSVGRLKRWKRLKGLDVEGCARVIALLHTAAKRQSFAEIVQKLPGLNPVAVFEDLHCIEGVMFLSGEPAGLTLHPELREELDRIAAGG
ncbi:membrane hypothetical protein [Verrucomicrobia bacterium]|nr:membrane hypothetical protein [Verrucomicrobiota bacterium]